MAMAQPTVALEGAGSQVCAGCGNGTRAVQIETPPHQKPVGPRNTHAALDASSAAVVQLHFLFVFPVTPLSAGSLSCVELPDTWLLLCSATGRGLAVHLARSGGMPPGPLTGR
ncbi:hypothetical protein D9Q98_006579 [Chlorella vulgaris]|uniref:Uncharacterized protein n=1 Tax=Chlorella vulgaris TaxID=3077 RepID=A0A9D4TKG1_CHLVU|nr:hypothetical protein D9Q98_006579 [Chlorella vulgaris]